MDEAEITAKPYFFLSYSRADDNGGYLKNFFEALRERVAARAGMAIAKEDPDAEEKFDTAGFFDRYGVKPAQDWKDRIGTQLQNSGVLVCAYSPNFFTRRQDKQFCGKEVTAFLMRDPQIRRSPGPGESREEFQFPQVDHILPIVWDKLGEEYPPYVMRRITWALDVPAASSKARETYHRHGMCRIVIGTARARPGGPYFDILTHLADRIIALAKMPLQPLAEAPDIDHLPSAFWGHLDDNGVDRAAAAAGVDHAVAAPARGGPQELLVIEIRGRNGPSAWSPYADEPSIAALVEQVAHQFKLAMEWLPLDPSEADFAERTSAELEKAAERSARAIVVVDPRCLANDAWRETLIRLLQEDRRAGLLLPADKADGEAALVINQHLEALKPASSAPNWVVRSCIGTVDDLRTAVSSLADDMRARIVNSDPVRRPLPENRGPSTPPRVTNR